MHIKQIAHTVVTNFEYKRIMNCRYLLNTELTNPILSRLHSESIVMTAKKTDRFVIFSDMHVGNGGSRDDFLQNAPLFFKVIHRFYYQNKYHLILNGDVEELQKFSLNSIIKIWNLLYHYLDDFRSENRLTKILGNHDIELFHERQSHPAYSKYLSLRLTTESGDLMIFHGHQASRYRQTLEPALKMAVRHILRPLGINNKSIPHDSLKKYNLEKRAYEFARQKRLIAIIGHTHRPLFESLSRVDILKLQIEQLCRNYPFEPLEKQMILEAKIKKYGSELHHAITKNARQGFRGSLYSDGAVIPCLFNSGCVIGKRGITAIEIYDGKIALVHWFDRERSLKYLNFNGYEPLQLEDTHYYRVVLKEENLDYIFTRIRLLA